MTKKHNKEEKFKTMIGGQALIEGIMMRGPQKDAIVIRGKDGLSVETSPRKVRSKKSVLSWPLIRGTVNFFDAQVTGIKATLRSADLAPEEYQEEPSKFDKWLEKKLENKKSRDFIMGLLLVFSLSLSIFIFFLIPSVIGSLFADYINNNLLQNLLEGFIRIIIFVVYMFLMSRIGEMKRVFSYHGAEHKTIRCYEAGLELTVENVRKQSRKHPRCGTSFLLVVMIISILAFSAASELLLYLVPTLALYSGTLWFKLLMIGYKLLLLPIVVAFSYEFNRLVARYDNFFTRILTTPGMWFQNFTTYEPDDEMIEVGIAALTAVLPEQEGEDLL